MSARMRVLITMLLMPVLTVAGIALLIAARYVGGATPLTAIIGGSGLGLYLAATIAGAALFGAWAGQRAG